MADPTNARLRDFDIPVVMPRFDFIEIPEAATAPTDTPTETPTPSPGVTTTTCSTLPAAAAPLPFAASTGITAPVVRLGLPAASKRTTGHLRAEGLPFSVDADKSIADVEFRLIELLDKGRIRPLGVKVVLEPVKGAVRAVVMPTPFASRKLAIGAKTRSVRAIAIVTAHDGSMGQTHADFTLTG